MSIAERPVELRTKVTISVDGQDVSVLDGDTILDACNAAGKDTPTVCYGPTVTPVNACRVCVVELEGSRTLVPSCSRPAEEGMVVTTDSDKVDHSRKMVLEFLATSSDVSQSDDIQGWLGDYGADLDRYDPETTERMTDEVKIEDDLYVRAYDRCVLCYKCVEACGEDAQWGLQPRPARTRQPDRQGRVAKRSLDHQRQPVRQGTLRLPIRPKPSGLSQTRICTRFAYLYGLKLCTKTSTRRIDDRFV